MSDLEFSNINLLTENNLDFPQNEILINNNILFQAQLNILKSKFNKLQDSILDIIDKKSFNFKNFLSNKMNIKMLQSPNNIQNNPKENNIINYNSNFNQNLSYSPIKRDKDDLDDIEILNETETNNVIIENSEKDFSNLINSDENINNYIIPPFHPVSTNEDIKSFSRENESSMSCNNNSKSFSSINNLFVVKTEKNNINTKKIIGKKRSNNVTKSKSQNKNKNLAKKEELYKNILDLYSQKVNNMDKCGNIIKIIENDKKDVQTIIVEDKKIWDIWISRGKIKQIYSYENNIFYTKNKDIIEQLNIIQKYFEDKCINLGLNINNDI